MENSRDYLIERLPGLGKIEELKHLLEKGYTLNEINIGLGNAIAYSQIEVAKFLISLGADISFEDYNGVYYAVHNNEIEGLIFSIEQGVSMDINDGILINTSIITAYNNKDISILKWLLNNGADSSLIMKDTLENFKSELITQEIEKFNKKNLK